MDVVLEMLVVVCAVVAKRPVIAGLPSGGSDAVSVPTLLGLESGLGLVIACRVGEAIDLFSSTRLMSRNSGLGVVPDRLRCLFKPDIGGLIAIAMGENKPFNSP